jgi:hypothetical protein
MEHRYRRLRRPLYSKRVKDVGGAVDEDVVEQTAQRGVEEVV